MQYEKQIFEPNQTLTAEELNLMDNQIYENGIAIESVKASKQDKLVSGTNIKTINGESILGSGDIIIEGSNSLPLSGGTLTGGLIAPSISSNNIQFNDNDELSTTENNYINFWPAGISSDTTNIAHKTFYRFLYGNGNLDGIDTKSKLHGLTIGPAIMSNIATGGASATVNEYDMHIDISNPFTSIISTPRLHIGNADTENVVIYGKATSALTAVKLNEKLTISVDGVSTEFDGSSSKTININTNTETINTSLFDVANTFVTITQNTPDGTEFDSNKPDINGNKDYIGVKKFIYKKLQPTPNFVNITIIPNTNVIKIIPTGSISNESFNVTYNTDSAKFEYNLSLNLPSSVNNSIPDAPEPGTDPFLNSILFEFKALILDGETVKTVDANLPLYFNA